MVSRSKINRRQFLKQTAAASAAAVTFPYVVCSAALGKAGTIAPSNRIVMGFIGVGGMGTYDLQAFAGKREVHIAAVCDVDKNHRDRAVNYINQTYGNKDCAGYNDFREVIARADIDAVSIALPDHWHSIPAIAAARAGKDIHAQKPLAYTIAEGRAMCEAVKRYKVVWLTGSQQRSDWKFRRACELVRNGYIGEVKTVKVGLPYGKDIVFEPVTKPTAVPEGFDYDMWLGPAPQAPYSQGRCHYNFRWISDYSGGQITDWAGHHCDIAQWGMGTQYTSPVEIEGRGVFSRAVEGLYDTAESYRFVCRYAEGFTMTVADSRQFPMGVRFEGSQGWIHVNRGGLHLRPESLGKVRLGPNDVHLYKSDDHKQNFIDCVRTRAETVAPIEVAHRSIMIGHLGLIAIKMGRKLHWDPQKEHFINDAQADRLLRRSMRSPWHI